MKKCYCAKPNLDTCGQVMSALEVCSSLIGLLFMEGHKGGPFDVSKVEISGESKVQLMEGCVGKSSKVFRVEQCPELEVVLPEVLFMVGHKASSSKVAKVNGVLKVEVFVEFDFDTGVDMSSSFKIVLLSFSDAHL